MRGKQENMEVGMWPIYISNRIISVRRPSAHVSMRPTAVVISQSGGYTTDMIRAEEAPIHLSVFAPESFPSPLESPPRLPLSASSSVVHDTPSPAPATGLVSKAHEKPE